MRLAKTLGTLFFCFSAMQAVAFTNVPPSLQDYCQTLLKKFREIHVDADPDARTSLHDLIDDLIDVESENLEVTTRYRKLMSQLSAAKLSTTELLKNTDDEELRRVLTTSKFDLVQRMKEATEKHLERTRDFEQAKEQINRQIAELTGEPIATIQAWLNRFYSIETQ